MFFYWVVIPYKSEFFSIYISLQEQPHIFSISVCLALVAYCKVQIKTCLFQ